MSYLRVCFLTFLVVVVKLSDSTEGSCDKEVTPGFKYTRLSAFEKSLKIAKATFEKIAKLFGKNSEKKDTSTCFSDVLNKFNKIKNIKLIPPGMLWCGDGNRAKYNDDLGYFNDTDACCRAHDMCENNIAAGNTLMNLKNDGIFTRSACSCDKAFYNCLKNISGLISKHISKQIGWTYFDMLGSQCFLCSCPTAKCNKNDDTERKGCCNRYEWVTNSKFIG